MRHIAKEGQIGSKTELELLLNVLDKARWVPQSLVRCALDQVKEAIINGTGPLRVGKALSAGTVTAADVDLLRRILYSFGGDGNLAITQAEAEVLFDVDAATAEADNHPSWNDLFVKAIANCVMGASGYATPPRAVALARDAWLERRGELSIDEVLSGMAGGIKSLFAGYREQTSEEQAIARLTQQKIEIITREAITPVEVTWLAERIGRDGKLTANERSLLMFLQAERPAIDPRLQRDDARKRQRWRPEGPRLRACQAPVAWPRRQGNPPGFCLARPHRLAGCGSASSIVRGAFAPIIGAKAAKAADVVGMVAVACSKKF